MRTNQGKGASLMDGMRYALAQRAACVVTLDGDGQHRPEDLSRLLACGQSWPGRIVIGSRRASGRAAPRARFIANRVADFWVSWAARHPIDDSQSGFRVYPAELLRLIAARAALARGFAFESEILIEAARLGFHTVAVDIRHDLRQCAAASQPLQAGGRHHPHRPHGRRQIAGMGHGSGRPVAIAHAASGMRAVLRHAAID